MTTKKWLVVLGLIGILILGNKLRTYSYATVPPPGENADEYAYGWLGLSLITGQSPEAWTSMEGAYDSLERREINVDHLYDGTDEVPPFVMASPWFDSPPLMGIITASYAYAKGARVYEDMSVILLRRPMLKIGLLTTVLIFWLGRRLYGDGVGLLAALLYSIVPVMLISSRLAITENGYSPLFVGALILADYYFEKKQLRYWVGACLLGFVAFFFKVSAIAILMSLFYLALVYGRRNQKQLVKYVVMASGFALVGYVLYGYVYGWETFVRVTFDQAGRFYGASSEAFYQAFTASKVTKNLTDGWLTLGWIALLMVGYAGWLKEKGSTILTVAFASYLIVFLIFGSEAYGHYRFPFFPLLVIASAKLLLDLFRRANLVVFVALMLLPFGTSLHRLVGVVGFQDYVSYFRYFVVVVAGLLAYSLLCKNRAVAYIRLAMIFVFVLVTYLSVKEIYFYNIDKWYFVN